MPKVNPIPAGMTAVTPHLVCAGAAEAIEFYKKAFGAVEETRLPGPGAKVTMPVADMFWGDRYGTFEDPFGHRWSVGTHVRDVTTEEMVAAMKAMSK